MKKVFLLLPNWPELTKECKDKTIEEIGTYCETVFGDKCEIVTQPDSATTDTVVNKEIWRIGQNLMLASECSVLVTLDLSYEAITGVEVMKARDKEIRNDYGVVISNAEPFVNYDDTMYIIRDAINTANRNLPVSSKHRIETIRIDSSIIKSMLPEFTKVVSKREKDVVEYRKERLKKENKEICNSDCCVHHSAYSEDMPVRNYDIERPLTDDAE